MNRGVDWKLVGPTAGAASSSLLILWDMEREGRLRLELPIFLAALDAAEDMVGFYR